MEQLSRPVGWAIALSLCAIFWVALTSALFWDGQRETAIAVLAVMVGGAAGGGLLLYVTRPEAITRREVRGVRAERGEPVRQRSPRAT